MATKTPATPATVLQEQTVNPVQNPASQTDSFWITQDFIAKQQAKRAAGWFNNEAPATVSATATQNEVVAPAPIIETAPVVTPQTTTTPSTQTDNVPATPVTVLPPTQSNISNPAQVKVKQEKPTVIDNKALLLNAEVDKNRKQGMNEQDAYETAFRKLIKPSVSDLRKSVPDTGRLRTQDERKAQFQNNTLKKYWTMTSEQLFNELKNGNITPALKTELQNSPAYQEASKKFDSYKQVSNINSNTAALLGKTIEKDPLMELSNNLTRIFTQWAGWESQVWAFRQYLSQNPTITSKTAEYKTQMAQKKELERARENIVKDLKAKYAWQPLSTILAMAARDSEPLNTQINSLNDSLTILGSEIKQETDFATQEFSLFREEQAAKQAKQQKLQEVLANLAISDYTTGQQRAFEVQKIQAAQQFEIWMEAMKNKYQNDRDANNYVRELEKIGVNNFYDLQKMEKDQNFQKQIEAIKNKYAMSRSVQELNNDIAKIGYQFNLQQQSKALDLANEKEMLDYKSSLDPDLAAKWEAVRAKATKNSSLADLYGKNAGTYKGNRGYDLAGKLWDAIVAPPWAKVIAIHALEDNWAVSVFEEWKWPMSKKDPGWGNSVLLLLPDGTKMRLSHLKDIGVNLGETLNWGQLVWTRGNTWHVLWANGETLTKEQLAAGRGAHVDVEIFDPSGKLLSQSQQLEYLKSVKPFETWTKKDEPLTDKQYTQFNQAIGRFAANPQVKAFEAALSSGGDLIASIKSENWPGDVAAVFQFMKTLDPASVVREGEFALAEASAGLPEKVGNIYEKVINGERLSDEQRKAFGKIAFKYIENKARLYDTHYNDMQKVLKWQNIPESYYPTKMSDYIKDFSGEKVTQQQQYDYADAYLKQLGY